VNDDLTVKGSATLSGMNLDGSLNATAIQATGDVATTGDVSGASLTASGAVSGASLTASGAVSGASLTASGNVSGVDVTASGDMTCVDITASGNVSGVDITASGDMTCDGLTTTGNSTLGNAIGDLQTLNGVVNINDQYVFADGTFSGSNQTLATSLNVAAGALVVSNAGGGSATFGADTIFGGEVSMAEGGSEVFNFNDHGLTNVGSIAFTTGGDITNCDEITCETLNVDTALNMDDTSLSLGTGSLTANGGINTTGSTSCRAINTNNSDITMGTGDLTCDAISSGSINTNNTNIYTGSGSVISSGTVQGLTVSGVSVIATDSAIVAGDGQFRCKYIDGGGPGHDTIYTNGDFLSETNRMVPSNVYDKSGQWVMPFDAGAFHPNDDSTYYNYCLEDDGSKTTGRGHIQSTSLEILGIIQIPNGWIATGTFVDIRDTSGNVITSSPPTYVVWKIQTSQTDGTSDNRVDMTGMYASAINTENAFVGGNTVTGVYNYALCIDISMTSTSHFLGGGYILLTAPS